MPEVKQEITDTMSLFLKSEWTKIFIFKIKVKLTKCHRDTKIKEKQNNYFFDFSKYSVAILQMLKREFALLEIDLIRKHTKTN